MDFNEYDVTKDDTLTESQMREIIAQQQAEILRLQKALLIQPMQELPEKAADLSLVKRQIEDIIAKFAEKYGG